MYCDTVCLGSNSVNEVDIYKILRGCVDTVACLIEQDKQYWNYANICFFVYIGTVVPLTYKYFRQANVNSQFVWDELAGSMSIVGVMICFEIIIKNLSHSKIASCIISLVNILVILPYTIFFVYSAATGDVIDVNALIAVYQTNINESIEFFRSYIDSFSIILLLGLLAFSAVVIMYANNNTNIDKFFGRNMLVNVVNVFAFIAYMGLAYKTLNYGYFGKISVESKQYLESVRNFNKLRYNSDGTKKAIKEVICGLKEGTYVVIIGESQNRRHMQAYGYERETTPWLYSHLHDNNFIFMTNGYSCHTLTMMCLSKALTQSSQYNGIEFHDAYSLVDIAGAAGVRTYWISNQSQYGAYSTPVTAIAGLSDKQEWINSDSTAANIFDEVILDKLEVIPKSGKNIVFIHLVGNHWEYKNRYPSEYSKFSDSKDSNIEEVADVEKLNEYDNSILYNDYVVSKIFDYAKSNWNVMNITYFSDHGEAVVSDKKHTPGRFEQDMATIPVYFYFSDKYFEVYPRENLFIKKDAYFTNDMIYDTEFGG